MCPQRPLLFGLHCIPIFMLLVFSKYPQPMMAQSEPLWWDTHGVINDQPADDNAAANIGQARHIASKANDYLDSTLAAHGGSGDAVDTLLLEAWLSDPGNQTQALLIGTLKYLAAPYYDRLNSPQVGLDTTALFPNQDGYYPWTSTLSNANADKQLATLGQLKFVFSFDLSNWSPPSEYNPNDWDNDLLTNDLEIAFGSDPNDPHSDEDILSDYIEYQLQTDPVVANAISSDSHNTIILTVWNSFQ